MKKKFDVIYADPPWDVNQKGNYGAIKHYNLMSLDDIKNMPIKDLTKENGALFLWVPNGLLQEGLDVLKAWGYKFRTGMYWIKPRISLGQYLRTASETLLFGTKGKFPVEFHSQPNWVFAPFCGHSVKPTEMYAIIERLYPNKSYLELFARKRPHNPQWYVFGDQAEGGSDIVIDGYPVPEYSDRASAEDEEA